MGIVGPWLVPVLLWLAHSGRLSAWEPQTEVWPPKNITIKSYNYNISVRWHYESPLPKPLFTVRIMCYSTGTSKEIATCTNITEHYCDLTDKTEQCETFWVGVKALSGQRESEYKEEKFDVLRDGQIGPPKFSLSINDLGIIVVVEPPFIPHDDPSLIEEFTYRFFLWEKGRRNERQVIDSEVCDLERCTENLPVPSLNTSYCVSVQVFSLTQSKIGEESEEKCISPPPKYSLGLTVLKGFGIAFLVLLVISLAVLFTKLQEKQIKLPKSLVAVVRNQVSNTDTKPESKYDIITSISYKPVPSQYKDERSIEKFDATEKVKITDPNDYGKEADADNSQEVQGERSIQEDMAVEIPENEQNHEDNINYSKSVAGQEVCNSLQNLDLLKGDIQQVTVLGNSLKGSGYDKPHWDISSCRDELLGTEFQ